MLSMQDIYRVSITSLCEVSWVLTFLAKINIIILTRKVIWDMSIYCMVLGITEIFA